jgi:hypothetical protein
LHFQFGQDERGDFSGGKEQHNGTFHQVEVQAGEIRERGTRIQDNSIQVKRRERGGEFVEAGGSHVVS